MGYGANVSINMSDSRETFWQWDVKQHLVVNGLPVGCEIHFDTSVSSVPLNVLVEEYNGTRIVKVPDEILQQAGRFKVWAYLIDGNGSRTVIESRFKVKAREKPPGYIYTPSEQITLNTILERLDQLAEDIADIECSGGAPYEGSYTVTPDDEEQVLETANKFLTEDIVVESIPYVEVPNGSNGITVVIAK